MVSMLNSETVPVHKAGTEIAILDSVYIVNF